MESERVVHEFTSEGLRLHTPSSPATGTARLPTLGWPRGGVQPMPRTRPLSSSVWLWTVARSNQNPLRVCHFFPKRSQCLPRSSKVVNVDPGHPILGKFCCGYPLNPWGCGRRQGVFR